MPVTCPLCKPHWTWHDFCASRWESSIAAQSTCCLWGTAWTWRDDSRLDGQVSLFSPSTYLLLEVEQCEDDGLVEVALVFCQQPGNLQHRCWPGPVIVHTTGLAHCVVVGPNQVDLVLWCAPVLARKDCDYVGGRLAFLSPWVHGLQWAMVSEGTRLAGCLTTLWLSSVLNTWKAVLRP